MICTIFLTERKYDDDYDGSNNRNGRAAPASALDSESKLAHRSVICCIAPSLSLVGCFFFLRSSASIFARASRTKIVTIFELSHFIFSFFLFAFLWLCHLLSLTRWARVCASLFFSVCFFLFFSLCTFLHKRIYNRFMFIVLLFALILIYTYLCALGYLPIEMSDFVECQRQPS